MSNKNIKVGDTYLLPITITEIRISGWLHVVTPCNKRYKIDPDDITKLIQDDIKNTETTPKYNPSRKFRNKDRVRVKSEVNGRPVYITKDACQPIDPNEIWEVVEEKKTGWVHLKRGVAYADAWHAMLELVTPGEEVGPYSIVQPENYKCVRVMEGKRIHSSIPFDEDECVCLTLEQALAAAEAECDRLNVKWRKEQNNG